MVRSQKKGSSTIKAPILDDFEDEDLVSQVAREFLVEEELIKIKLRNKKE